MEPSFTAAPSPSLNEASIVISEIKEKQSGAPSKSEQCQKLQENRPGHFVGVDEGNFLVTDVLSSLSAYTAVSRKVVGKKSIKCIVDSFLATVQ